MFGVRRETVERLRREYPVGCRVELVQMRLRPLMRSRRSCGCSATGQPPNR